MVSARCARDPDAPHSMPPDAVSGRGLAPGAQRVGHTIDQLPRWKILTHQSPPAGGGNPLGKGIGQCLHRRRRAEFLRFEGLRVHLIREACPTHEHAEVEAMAGRPSPPSHALHPHLPVLDRRRRTPAPEITEKRPGRGTLHPVPDLIAMIPSTTSPPTTPARNHPSGPPRPKKSPPKSPPDASRSEQPTIIGHTANRATVLRGAPNPAQAKHRAAAPGSTPAGNAAAKIYPRR
jgi:hypothetical protein